MRIEGDTSILKKWFYLSIGFILITSIVYSFSFLINDRIDWNILLFLNPDSYVPVIDEFMILITDFSMFGFGLVFVVWEICYQVTKGTQRSKESVNNILNILGIISAAITVSAYFWAGYAYSIIFFPLALFFWAAFRFIGNTIANYSAEKLAQINRLFWITLLATVLTELATDQFIKELVARPRPLSETYAAFNAGLRRVPDEIVLGGYSYVSSHASVFFAMSTPLMWFVSKKYVKAALFIWASIHAFTRIYLAAHFPYCTLMGAVLGFSMATLVIKIFGESSQYKVADCSSQGP